MRKISIILLLTAALAGCQKNTGETVIKGEIANLKSDTIYLYGMGGLYSRTDTILAEDGKFTCTIKPDTTSIVALLLNHQTVYPLFVEKGDRIRIQGDAGGVLEVEGNPMNEEFTVYRKEISGLGKPSEKMLEQKAEEYILSHPASFISVYLLDTYFVQKTSPDFQKIKALIEPMSGMLQDVPYIQGLRKQLEQAENAGIGRTIPYFSLPNQKGENITRTGKYQNKYIVIHFWASWSDACQADFAALRKMNSTYVEEPKAKKKKKNEPETPAKKGLALLGISLDLDKQAWKDAIKKDTLKWEQVCNFQGVESETTQQFGVLRVPTLLLVSPDGHILARDISADSLSRKLAEYPLEKR